MKFNFKQFDLRIKTVTLMW